MNSRWTVTIKPDLRQLVSLEDAARAMNLSVSAVRDVIRDPPFQPFLWRDEPLVHDYVVDWQRHRCGLPDRHDPARRAAALERRARAAGRASPASIPQRPVVGLVAHSQTGYTGSIGTLCAQTEAAISRNFATVKLSPTVLWAPRETRDQIWTQFLSSCDVVVGGAGLGASDESHLAELRETLGLPFRLFSMPHGSLPRGAFDLRRALPFLRATDKIVFSCSADLGIFDRLVASSAAEPAVIPFAVDDGLFTPLAGEERAARRRQFGYSDDEIVFTYIGRVTAEKNLHTVLELIDALFAVDPRIRLLIVGPFQDVPFIEFHTGPYDIGGLLAEMVAASPRLQRAVRVAPPMSRQFLPVAYSISDALVNLTLHHDENFGLAQIEAMACGVPVVCTDWGGLKDTVAHQVSGFRVPTWSSERGIQLDKWAAFEACRALAASPDLRRRMGGAGRARVEAEFGESTLSERWARALTDPAAADAADESALSELGDRYEAAFPSQGDEPWIASYSTETYDLYRQLIGPYTSDVSPPPWDGGRTAFLQPLSFALDRNVLDIRDPLWPRAVELTDLEARVVKTLHGAAAESGNTFVRVEDLAARVECGERCAELFACLERLRSMGVVGASTSQDPR